jgi:hypothetical protein
MVDDIVVEFSREPDSYMLRGEKSLLTKIGFSRLPLSPGPWSALRRERRIPISPDFQ